jgi:hypothetical protein
MTDQDTTGQGRTELDMYDLYDDGTTFIDLDGFVVRVGTVVGFTEESETPETAGKSYLVVALPNLADMVDMCESTDEGDILDKTVISVEPWKIGAI